MIPYEGNEPYIFISYAHKDSDRVLPLLEGLFSRGYRVWYDAGIEAGTEWPDYIAEHLENAGAVLAFLSEASLASVNCRQEIMYALDLEKPALTAYLEDVKLTGGMRMRLGLVQAIYRTRHASADSFLDELCRASLLAPCKGEAPVSPKAEVPAATAPKAEAPAEEAPMPKSTKDLKIEGRTLVVYAGKGELLFGKSGSPAKVAVPSGVETLRSEAFKDSAITAITFPQSLKELQSWALAGCRNLTDVAFPDKISLIPFRFMSGCESLSSVKLPAEVKTVGSFAFFECASLSEIEFPEGLEEIGNEAFRKCASLKSVTLPKSLKTVGDGAFLGCKKLKTVTIYKDTQFTPKSFPSTAKIIYL